MGGSWVDMSVKTERGRKIAEVNLPFLSLCFYFVFLFLYYNYYYYFYFILNKKINFLSHVYFLS